MRTIFVVNPKAGKEDSVQKITKAAMETGSEVHATTGRLDATRFVQKTIVENPGEELRFIACGGDGTINEVFSPCVGHKNVSVSVYPCGSGNDFVKTFGGREKFLDPKALISAQARPIDVLRTDDGKYSVNVLNFGFDTTVAIKVNTDRDKNGHGSKNSYTTGVIQALITSMHNRFTVKADGETLNPDGTGLLCTLGNGQYVGGSFRCAPRADIADGLCEVCLVKCVSRVKFVSLIGTYVKGEHLDDPKMKDLIVYRRAKKIEVDAPEGFAYTLDGEIIHNSHFTVEVLPGALNFACPE